MRATNLLAGQPRPVEAAPSDPKPLVVPWVAPPWAQPVRASVGVRPGPEYWPDPPARTKTRDGRLGVGSTDERRRWARFLDDYPAILASMVANRITAMGTGGIVERLIADHICGGHEFGDIIRAWRHLAGVAPSREPRDVEHRREVLNALIGRVALGVSRPQLADLCGLGYGTVGKAKEAKR